MRSTRACALAVACGRVWAAGGPWRGFGKQIGLRPRVIERQFQDLLGGSVDVVLQQEIFGSGRRLIDFSHSPIPGDGLIQMIDDILARDAGIVRLLLRMNRPSRQGKTKIARPRRMNRSYSSMPAMQADMKFASVPTNMAFNPSRARSDLREGASAPMPPI